MFVIVDEREIVTSGSTSRFKKEGVSSTGFCPDEFREWVGSVAEPDLGAIEAFLLGDCKARETYPRMIRERSRAPVIAMNELHSLEQTLDLFAAGVDDVVVMLDAGTTFASLPPDDLFIYWGAYLGTDDELLISGPLAEVADEIVTTRAEARARKGWMFDTYLLRRHPT